MFLPDGTDSSQVASSPCKVADGFEQGGDASGIHSAQLPRIRRVWKASAEARPTTPAPRGVLGGASPKLLAVRGHSLLKSAARSLLVGHLGQASHARALVTRRRSPRAKSGHYRCREVRVQLPSPRHFAVTVSGSGRASRGPVFRSRFPVPATVSGSRSPVGPRSPMRSTVSGHGKVGAFDDRRQLFSAGWR